MLSIVIAMDTKWQIPGKVPVTLLPRRNREKIIYSGGVGIIEFATRIQVEQWQSNTRWFLAFEAILVVFLNLILLNRFFECNLVKSTRYNL